MGSAERLFFNVDEEIEEGSYETPKPKYSKTFPSKGEIEVNNICVRYRENLPLILKNLSFKIYENEKIGVVGRTGSGKSSLLLALTRIINVENSEYYFNVQFDQKLGPFKEISKKKLLKNKKKVKNYNSINYDQINSLNNLDSTNNNQTISQNYDTEAKKIQKYI